jgi:hypothetical protein
MDIWQMPALALSAPAAGRALARYRAGTLRAAQDIAAQYGYSGAYYPLESVAPRGYEGVVTAANQGGTSEEHTSLDVAIGLWEVAMVTGDDDFGRLEVWPVLRDVAWWVCTRGQWRESGQFFSILHTGGPDEEGHRDTNDSSFMNVAAIKALEAALAAATRFQTIGSDSAEFKRWQRVRDGLVLPLSSGSDAATLLPYDGAPSCRGPHQDADGQACNRTTYQVGTVQYLHSHGLPSRLNTTVARATWALEETLRTLNKHCDVTGPSQHWCSGGVPTTPLSPGFTLPPFINAAAFYGRRDTALELYRLIAQHYVMAPWGLFTEYRVDKPWKMATYLTTAGSVLQTVLFGLSGLRADAGDAAASTKALEAADFTRFAATLPEGWEVIRAAVTLGGVRYTMEARHGAKAVLTPLVES